MIKTFILAIVLILGSTLEAANHYVRAAASGTAAGTDWTNACTDFTGSCAAASLVRGDTYYVATGTYAFLQLDEADSGSLVTTIKGATLADHGTGTGWSNSFSVSSADGGAQAQLSFSASAKASVNIVTDHWVFDGSVGSGNDVTTYGFRMKKSADCTVSPQAYLQVGNSGSTTTDIIVKHISLDSCGTGNNTSQRLAAIGCGDCFITNLTLSNTYSTNAGGMASLTNVKNSTLEYNYVEHMHYVGSNSFKEAVTVTNCQNADFAGCANAQCTQGACAGNVTFRYNIIKDCDESGMTGGLIGLGPGNALAMLNWKIYGNTFVNCTGNSGTIAGINTFAINSTVIYNNTFVSSQTPVVQECDNGGAGCSSASGNTFENNLLWSSGSNVQQFQGAAWTKDYNAYLSATDTPPVEVHGQTTNFNPFLNSATGDYHLLADAVVSCLVNTAVCSGLSLGSPYNIDPDGNARGADGTWERGAYEVVGPVVVPAAAPGMFGIP